MSAAVTTAIVGLITTLVAGYVAARQTLRLGRHRLERRKLKDRELNAEDVLAKYREPLAAAAIDLQSRCYNIVRLGFFERFDRNHERYSASSEDDALSVRAVLRLDRDPAPRHPVPELPRERGHAVRHAGFRATSRAGSRRPTTMRC